MASTRRQFLKRAGLWALALPAWAQVRLPGPATLDPNRLARYVQPLPVPPRAQPLLPDGEPIYRLRMVEAHPRFHPDLPPTRCWTYEGILPGPTLELHRGRPATVEWVNALPPRHFLPVDHTLEGAAVSLPPVRAVVHLHGARVPASSDGYPEDWIVPGQSQWCHYPNPQAAAPLLYHDHAMGLARLNVYAGLFGLCWLRDEIEAGLALPSGEYEVPLALCDRWLTPHGQLYYPTSGDVAAPWVPEVQGNLILVNGALWPELAVEPRSYRLRIANVANGRTFHLVLAAESPLQLIGTGQGLLDAPAPLRSLTLAPAERADLIVDFRAAQGQRLELRNDGEPILRFQVRAAVAGAGVGARAAGPWPALPRLPESAAVRTRQLCLREYDDPQGQPRLMLLDGKFWHDAVSEQPRLGETEIWEFVNPTDDTHPIHLHMVRFQILGRRYFDTSEYLVSERLRFTSPVETPGADEWGWKDTVRCYPGALTRIIVPFEGFAGRYLWHCHILEHAANQMMRPYEILPAESAYGT
ncbi:MAG: multicopper oxidase family protein [Terriglobales bacterium]